MDDEDEEDADFIDDSGIMTIIHDTFAVYSVTIAEGITEIDFFYCTDVVFFYFLSLFFLGKYTRREKVTILMTFFRFW